MLDVIAKTRTCRYMSREHLQDFLDSGSLHQLDAGTRLFGQGDPGESMFVILSGGVSIVKVDKGGAEQTLTSLGPGEIVGEMSMVDCQPRSAKAVVFADATLFEMSRKQLVQLAKTRPDIASRLLFAVVETISVRLRQTEGLYQAVLARTLAAQDTSGGGF